MIILFHYSCIVCMCVFIFRRYTSTNIELFSLHSKCFTTKMGNPPVEHGNTLNSIAPIIHSIYAHYTAIVFVIQPMVSSFLYELELFRRLLVFIPIASYKQRTVPFLQFYIDTFENIQSSVIAV